MNFGRRRTRTPATGSWTGAGARDQLLDTANVYGQKKGEGVTEQIIGRWLVQGGGRRERVVLATKVYNAMGDWPNQSRLSALHIRQACEASLRGCRRTLSTCIRCTTSPASAVEEIWQAMELLVLHGKVIYVGAATSRVAHRAGQERAPHATSWACFGAEPVQSERPHGGAGGDSRCQSYGLG